MDQQQLLEQFGPREAMEYDVVIVGGGPGGLATAIRLKQLAAEKGGDVNVCVLEKGSEPGAHILSGAMSTCCVLHCHLRMCHVSPGEVFATRALRVYIFPPLSLFQTI